MDIRNIIINQKKYFDSGKTRKYEVRKEMLNNLAKSIKYYEKDILKALEKDLNKSSYEAYMTEIGLCLQEVKFAIKNLKKWMKPIKKSVGINAFPGRAWEVSEPYGRVLIISPWNYPFSLCIMPLIGAIAAGNCVVVKPSELAPNVEKIIGKIIEDAFEQEFIAVIRGGSDISKKLLEEKFDYIFFTGSTDIGKYVMQKASENLTPVTLELGGKSPCIVTADADIDESSKNIAFGKMLNSGQTCVAPDYILIDEKIKEEFCKKLSEQFSKMLPQGIKTKTYPKIINEKHFERIVRYMGDGRIYSGGKIDYEIQKIEPTILLDVGSESGVMREEIFGPIMPVISYKTLDEAERFVKERGKPLALYLFTSDKKIEKKVFQNISFGGGCINDTITHITCKGLGFGGVGSSGMGSYHGKYTFDTFSHKKSIYKKSRLFEVKLRYAPYDKNSKKLRKIIK